MRNLKRVLSLALALVMVLGMMVIGTSAATYADAAEIDYTEAVDVMSALGVLEGDGTNFNPDDILTREQAAKIVAYILLGEDKADKLTGTGTFTDVAATRWSAGYIDYCASLDILAGNGDGTYNPTGKLTGVAFAKMLLVMLGFDPAEEGYVNDANWATNISADAIDNELDVKDILLADEVSREIAAQMALNALTWSATGYTYYAYNDANTNEVLDAAEAKIEAESLKDAGMIAGLKGAGWTTTKVKNTSDTMLKAVYDVDKGILPDAFGRPGTSYELNDAQSTILYYSNTPVATYTDKALTKTVPGMKNVLAELKDYYLVNGATKYKVSAKVGDSTITFADLVATNGTDGDLTAAATVYGTAQTFADAIAGLTADNKTVEVYATPQKVITKIVVVETFVDTIATVTEADETTDTDAYVTLTTNSTYTFDTEAFAKGDVVLFTYADSKVQSMTKAASFVGTLSTFAKGEFHFTYTIGGTEYEVWSGDTSEDLNAEIQGYLGVPKTYYLGQNNMIVAVDDVKGTPAAFDGYAMITAAAYNKTVATTLIPSVNTGISVAAVLSDGTQGVFTLPAVQNKDKSWTITVGTTEIDVAANATNAQILTALGGSGAIYSYTLNGTELTLVAGIEALTTATLPVSAVKVTTGTGITKASTTITNGVSDKTIVANENTVFVLNDERTDAVITKTGIAALEDTSSFSGTVVVNVTSYKDKTGTTRNALVAAYVFAPTVEFASSTATVGVNDYAYVDGTYVVTKDAITKLPVYTATGYKADGTTIALEKGNEAAGIYKFNSDNELDNTTNFGTEATVVSINGTTVGLDDGSTTAYVTVNSTTKTVIVGRGAALEVGATVCYYDVDPAGDVTPDGVVDLLYVIEGAE